MKKLKEKSRLLACFGGWKKDPDFRNARALRFDSFLMFDFIQCELLNKSIEYILVDPIL